MDKWISVKSKLPTELGGYLVTMQLNGGSRVVDELLYDPRKEAWIIIDYELDSEGSSIVEVEYPTTNVIAWMEVPEPYDGE